MRYLENAKVRDHFKNILKRITTNDKIDRNKIKELENTQIMTKIGQGYIAKIYKIKLDNNYYALKLFHENFHENIENFDLLNEIETLKITSRCVRDNICPNVLYGYGSSDKINKYILLEYIDTSIYDFFENLIITKDNASQYIDIISSMIFQILVGLLVLHEIYDIAHNDLHLKNIFIKKIDKDTVFQYNINNIKYTVPTYGYLIILGDHGRSVSYDILKSQKYLFYKKGKADMYKKFKDKLVPFVIENYESLKFFHNRIIKSYLVDMINDVIKYDGKNIIKKNQIDKHEYNKIKEYVIKNEKEKNDYNDKEYVPKRIVQLLCDTNNIKLINLLPPHIFKIYLTFKNILPQIFTFAETVPVSYILDMFFSIYTDNKEKYNIHNDNIFVIESLYHSTNTIKNYRDNINFKYIMKNKYKYVETFKGIFSDLSKKNIDVYIEENKESVTKIFTFFDGKGIENINNYGYATIKIYNEFNSQNYELYKQINKLINYDICPHFLETYYYYNYYNVPLKIDEKVTNHFFYLLNNIGMTFDNDIITHSTMLCESLLFQLVVIFYSVQKYLKYDSPIIVERMIRYINILPKISFKYIINNKNYYVPIYGYMLVLASPKMLDTQHIIDDRYRQFDTKELYENCMGYIKFCYVIILVSNMKKIGINTIDNIYNICSNTIHSKLDEIQNEIKNKIQNTNIQKKDIFIARKCMNKCIEYLYDNDLLDFSKYIDPFILNIVKTYKNKINDIILEKNIEDIFSKHFKNFEKQINITKTFAL